MYFFQVFVSLFPRLHKQERFNHYRAKIKVIASYCIVLHCTIVLRVTFHATFRCGNMLQILKLIEDLQHYKVRPYAPQRARRNYIIMMNTVTRNYNVAIKIVWRNMPLPTPAATKLPEKRSRVTCVNNRR